MASELSRSLILPCPSYCGAARQSAPLRLWKEPSRRSGSRKAIQSGRFCITACYSTVPAPSETLQNGVPEDNGAACTPSPLSPDTTNGRAQSNAEELGFEEVVDRFDLPEVTESYYLLEAREDQASYMDPELQGIITNIADVEKLNEMLGERMQNIQELLGRTTRSLNAKAQEAKIEAAKLKKLAKLHQLEEIRHAENMRNILKARMKMEFSTKFIADKLLDLGPTKDPKTASDDEQATEVTLEEIISGSEDQSESKLIAFPEVLGDESVRTTSPLSRVESEQNLENSSLFKDTEEGMLGPAAVISESEECIFGHPGALSCTKTVIKSDPLKKSAVITMETTVRCDADAFMVASLEADDYIALGVQALADTAQELKKVRFARARDLEPLLDKKHASVLDLLENGRVVKAKPMEPPSKFGHESFVIELLNDKTGEKIEAVFKPGIEGNADGWHRAPIEMVAYKLNLMLGMDYVPPVVYKSGGVDVNYKHYHDGAFVYFVPNTKHLRKVPATNWGVSVALLLSDTRILDVLLNNSDRHHGHFLFGRHWADGRMGPVLIDHAAGFRKEAVVKMDDENAFKTGAVKCVSARTYLRLRFLEKENVALTFEGLLSSREVNELMQRRDMILAYLDDLVKERGYHRTVIEA